MPLLFYYFEYNNFHLKFRFEFVFFKKDTQVVERKEKNPFVCISLMHSNRVYVSIIPMISLFLLSFSLKKAKEVGFQKYLNIAFYLLCQKLLVDIHIAYRLYFF